MALIRLASGDLSDNRGAELRSFKETCSKVLYLDG